MPPRAQLLFYCRDTGLKGARLAKHLNISGAYVSLLLSGARPVPVPVIDFLTATLANSAPYQAFCQTIAKMEQRLRRPLEVAEQCALADGWPDLAAPLTSLNDQEAYIGQDAPLPPSHGTDHFAVATALASLQSISQILVEEPALPEAQRQAFLQVVSDQSKNLTQLLTIADQETKEEQSQAHQRPDRFVDLVFAGQNYYFAQLEHEADLLVRRTRRYGPLGTFTLAQRLDTDLGIPVDWQEGGGMRPSSLSSAPPSTHNGRIQLDPSLGQAQLRFRLAQYLVAHEADGLLNAIVTQAAPPNEACAQQLKKALIAYTSAAMFMPYDDFLLAAQQHRYDLDWLSRHFACSFEQVCHRLLALRQPGRAGVPFGMLRVSPAGQTISRIPLPGLALPDRFAACPLWAAYEALRQSHETVTQLAELPNQERFLFVARLCTGPRAQFGGPRRLTSLMLICDWAYADQVIYADAHDPQRPASLTPVGHACVTCPRDLCPSRVRPLQGTSAP